MGQVHRVGPSRGRKSHPLVSATLRRQAGHWDEAGPRERRRQKADRTPSSPIPSTTIHASAQQVVASDGMPPAAGNRKSRRDRRTPPSPTRSPPMSLAPPADAPRRSCQGLQSLTSLPPSPSRRTFHCPAGRSPLSPLAGLATGHAMPLLHVMATLPPRRVKLLHHACRRSYPLINGSAVERCTAVHMGERPRATVQSFKVCRDSPFGVSGPHKAI